jgi:hypothetical protein
VAGEIPFEDFHVGASDGKGAVVDFLSEGLVWVTGGAGNHGGAIEDPLDRHVSVEPFGEPLEVEPVEAVVSNNTVIEIESVDVDAGSLHLEILKKRIDWPMMAE